MKATPFAFYKWKVAPGESRTFDYPLAQLATHNALTMPVQIRHGRSQGPCLLLTAAIHGDELNGVEIIRRVMRLPALKRLRGTILAVPIVNVHGFLQMSRYLPDRRDLNRSFPGSSSGSLAARYADSFIEHIVSRCTHGVDLHTGAFHRCNLPQIRADLGVPETKRLARAFAPPVILNSAIRDGSLREAAGDLGVPMLLYEAGEAFRFDETSIRTGVQGIVRVMRAIEMLPPLKREPRRQRRSLILQSSRWLRAPGSGVFRTLQPLGAHVHEGQVMGIIADPFGEREVPVTAADEGVIIGRNNLPIVNEGDALFHVAQATRKEVERAETLRAPGEAIDMADPDSVHEPPIV